MNNHLTLYFTNIWQTNAYYKYVLSMFECVVVGPLKKACFINSSIKFKNPTVMSLMTNVAVADNTLILDFGKLVQFFKDQLGTNMTNLTVASTDFYSKFSHVNLILTLSKIINNLNLGSDQIFALNIQKSSGNIEYGHYCELNNQCDLNMYCDTKLIFSTCDCVPGFNAIYSDSIGSFVCGQFTGFIKKSINVIN